MTIKIKPLNVKSSTYKIDFNNRNNKENPKFEIDDHVTVSKYKNILATFYVPNWSDKVSVIKKVKNSTPWHTFWVILIVRKLLERFMKKNCKKTNQTEFRVKKLKKAIKYLFYR